MVHRVAIVGAGSWGTALSAMLAKKGIQVKLWVREREICEQIEKARENIRYLPGVLIPSDVFPTQSLEEALKGAELTVLAVPSQYIRGMAQQIAPFVPSGHVIVNVAKGLEMDTLLRLSQVIEQEIPSARVAVLSGPSHAEEVGRDIPTAVVCASYRKEDAEFVQDVFMGPTFRVYTNPDVIGVEMGGALKNIIALAAGISDGLGFGDNSKAALITRGIAEISRLGQAMGAHPLTFAGLAGIGDLVVTCTSMHSRNRRAGILIGQGKPLEEVLDSIGMVVEGVTTCKAAYQLANKHGISMPITEQLYHVLFEGKHPKEAVSELMLRSRTHEIEEVVSNMDIRW